MKLAIKIEESASPVKLAIKIEESAPGVAGEARDKD